MSQDNDVRPPIKDIIARWTIKHGERFKGEQRKLALIELMNAFAYYGYSRGSVEANKNAIVLALWNKDWKGKHSPEWRRSSEKAVKNAIDEKFAAHVEFPDYDVPVKNFEPSEDVPVELPPIQEEYTPTVNENTPDPDIQLSEDVEFDDKPVLRPLLDRSRFSGIETTDIMPVEDFLAMLERAKDEQ